MVHKLTIAYILAKSQEYGSETLLLPGYLHRLISAHPLAHGLCSRPLSLLTAPELGFPSFLQYLHIPFSQPGMSFSPSTHEFQVMRLKTHFKSCLLPEACPPHLLSDVVMLSSAHQLTGHKVL